MDKLETAILRHNARGYGSVMNMPVFRREWALIDQAFKKKVLLPMTVDKATPILANPAA